MSLLGPSTQYAAGGALLALLIAFVLFQPTGLVKWLQKKNYQYEVTFSLYMLTPTEKFVFNSILFLMISMLTIATVVYLPNHVATISRRVYYYFAGDAVVSDTSRTAASQLGDTASKASAAALGAATAAQEAVNQVTENLGWS
ncbi:hypothetical protein LTR37_013079 [Vermiconidia calcicola]|uniref:Uncharacterized protein n=1 Tax=Vermiconidia calcicola TaxID=1690605 RepID=A0ACC3N059_9PEZI|nr:hypothetical protein LTR37_013079 [Vermiconidia calcicola]